MNAQLKIRHHVCSTSRIAALLVAFCWMGCDTSSTAETVPKAAESAVQTFGAPVQAQEFLTLQAVLSAPQDFAGKTVAIAGVVRKSCKNKGCWMELATGANKDDLGCRVTFKDYGFFVPLDAAGSLAKLEGVLDIKTVPKDQVDHLEAEGAKFANKAADGTATEVQILATGVILERPLPAPAKQDD